ncbi:MAG: phosphate ABC transporter permease subunit PstC, partial [Candidatus Izemoplasmatales bacterium]
MLKIFNTIKIKLQSKHKKDYIDIFVKALFFLTTLISASFIVIIAIFILREGIRPFIDDYDGIGRVNLIRFLMGTTWLEGQTFQSNLYGVGFIIINTLYIAFLSLFLSLPIGVLTALFIAKIAPKRLASVLRTIIELLAAIPSIVYGLVGSGVIL